MTNHTRPCTLAQVDPEIAAIVDAEFDRQQYTIELIASENLTSCNGNTGKRVNQQVC